MHNSKPLFKKLLAGDFRRDQISVKWEPRERVLSAENIQAIDNFWQSRILSTSKKEYVFNGALVRLNSWEVTDRQLTLHLGNTDYKELMFSNHQVISGSPISPDELAYALGISATVVSADDHVIMIRRSDRVGEYPGTLSIIGGHIHPVEHAESGRPNPFVAMREELQEEIDLTLPETALRCIGLVETVRTRKPELIFAAQSDLTADEIIETGKRKEWPEVVDILPVPADALMSFVEGREEEFSPSAYGGLCLFLEVLHDV